MRSLRSIIKVSVFILLTGILFLYASATASFAEDSFENEVASFYSVKGDDEMAGEKRRSHFFRSSRYLSTRLGEQRIAFSNKNEGKSFQVNKVSSVVEEFANEANMMASQGEFEDGIKLIVKAHDIVTASLKEIGGN